MTVAIMQPYVFPYIGYFQLIYASDNFVFYDDVDFIKGGWVNRNKILINNKENLFTIPLKKASSFKLISETELHPVLYKKWRKKFFKSLEQSYGKAPYFGQVFPLIEGIFNEDGSLADLAMKSVRIIGNYLEIKSNFLVSSKDFPGTKGLDRAERIIEISRKLESNNYINMPGGKKLYDKAHFRNHNINLQFLEPKVVPYNQSKVDFTAGLSIIDILMFCSKTEIVDMLGKYSLQ